MIACGKGAVGCTQKACAAPQSTPHTQGLILSASDGIWNMLFSTYSHTSRWVTARGHFRHTCECSLSRSTFCIDAFTVFFGWVTVCCAMVQAKCLHLIVSLFHNSLTMGTAAEVVASDILVGRAATHQVLGSFTIIEQRIGRHSHSTTAAASGRRHACGTAVPISFAQNDEAEEHPASP